MPRRQMNKILEEFPKDKVAFQLLQRHAMQVQQRLLKSDVLKMIDEHVQDYLDECHQQDVASATTIFLDMIQEAIHDYVHRLREEQ